MGMNEMRKPLARSEGLVVEGLDDELVVYDLESKDVHCLSPLAAAVFAHCDGRSSKQQIAALASKRLGRTTTADDVSSALAQLEERALLDAPSLAASTNGDSISRRVFIRRSALAGTVAAATPLIASVAAPTAAHAITGIPPGCTGCTKNSDCVTNHCCQMVPGHQCLFGCCVIENNSCHLTDPNCTDPTCPCTVTLATCPPCPPGTGSCCTPA
jgi:hypothetical protein